MEVGRTKPESGGRISEKPMQKVATQKRFLTAAGEKQ